MSEVGGLINEDDQRDADRFRGGADKLVAEYLKDSNKFYPVAWTKDSKKIIQWNKYGGHQGAVVVRMRRLNPNDNELQQEFLVVCPEDTNNQFDYPRVLVSKGREKNGPRAWKLLQAVSKEDFETRYVHELLVGEKEDGSTVVSVTVNQKKERSSNDQSGGLVQRVRNFVGGSGGGVLAKATR